jgi:hypothetical protein
VEEVEENVEKSFVGAKNVAIAQENVPAAPKPTIKLSMAKHQQVIIPHILPRDSYLLMLEVFPK